MVAFTLHNKTSKDKPFRAYFTRDSPSEFTITPERGVLVPDSSKKEDDNRFVVGYKPTTYGKTLVGTLIVEGDEISSSYEVRDQQSRYAAFGGIRRAKRNFVKENALGSLGTPSPSKTSSAMHA
eukprot:jgi/Hompol1/5550/HPOL_004534-RA